MFENVVKLTLKQWRKAPRLTLLGVVSAIYLLQIYTSVYRVDDIKLLAKLYSPPDDLRGTEIFGECKLKIYDPFYKKIKKTVKRIDPFRNCNRTYQYITKLIDGRIVLNPTFPEQEYNCSARCWNSTSPPKEGAWVQLKVGISTEALACEFIETQCINYKDDNITEHHAHFQLLEQPSDQTVKAVPEGEFRPDVHIILLDSVASTQALRSLPVTIDFLRRNMSATFFHHLNKVGGNSRPNGFAMLLGYTTLYSEDYPGGTVFTYPYCRGFKNNPTTHSIRPFISIRNRRNVKMSLKKSGCFSLYQSTMDYTGEFMNAYKGKPKFSLTWIATLAHDSANMLYHSDSYFEKFFRDNEPKLRNSFVFFLGDHGLRYGSTRYTELGDREANNPFLMLSVPERLRSNQQLMKNLKDNSEKLLTPYDIFATLLDILKEAPTNNFTNFDFREIIQKNENNGTSLLRPLGRYGNRNCRNIPVPASYCLCEFDKERVKSDPLTAILSKFLIDEINKILVEEQVEQRCPPIMLKKALPAWKYTSNNTDFGLYIVSAKAVPGNGKFRGTVRLDHVTGNLQLMDEIQRTNSYGKRGNCVKDVPHVRQFCNCAE